MLYKWANEVLPDNSVILTTHRSIAFYKYKAIPYEFRLFSNSHKKRIYILFGQYLKRKTSFILYSSNELNNSNDILKIGENCSNLKKMQAKSGKSFFQSEIMMDTFFI